MERTFAVILSELRKEKGLSQKEAAAQLGISQALLSHYEKGIRECGQSFLIKVADFYDVTCDYLLGRTSERVDVEYLASILFDSRDDMKPTSKTMIKAVAALRSYMNENECLNGIRLDIYLAIQAYKLILLQAQAGNLPKNWAGRAYVDGEICCNPFYLGQIELSSYHAISPTKNKVAEKDSPMPDSIKTLVNIAEDYVFKTYSANTPPIPSEYLR